MLETKIAAICWRDDSRCSAENIALDIVGIDRPSRSVVFGEARWCQEPYARHHLERLIAQSQAWLHGSDAHWDVHYAVYARNLAPGLQALVEQERNLHLFTPETVVTGGESCGVHRGAS